MTFFLSFCQAEFINSLINLFIKCIPIYLLYVCFHITLSFTIALNRISALKSQSNTLTFWIWWLVLSDYTTYSLMGVISHKSKNAYLSYCCSSVRCFLHSKNMEILMKLFSREINVHEHVLSLVWISVLLSVKYADRLLRFLPLPTTCILTVSQAAWCHEYLYILLPSLMF